MSSLHMLIKFALVFELAAALGIRAVKRVLWHVVYQRIDQVSYALNLF